VLESHRPSPFALRPSPFARHPSPFAPASNGRGPRGWRPFVRIGLQASPPGINRSNPTGAMMGAMTAAMMVAAPPSIPPAHRPARPLPTCPTAFVPVGVGVSCGRARTALLLASMFLNVRITTATIRTVDSLQPGTCHRSHRRPQTSVPGRHHRGARRRDRPRPSGPRNSEPERNAITPLATGPAVKTRCTPATNIIRGTCAVAKPLVGHVGGFACLIRANDADENPSWVGGPAMEYGQEKNERGTTGQ
jgi:hypothetical protein